MLTEINGLLQVRSDKELTDEEMDKLIVQALASDGWDFCISCSFENGALVFHRSVGENLVLDKVLPRSSEVSNTIINGPVI